MYIMIAVLLGISPESGQEMWVGEYIGLLFAGGIQSPLSFFGEVYQRLPWSTQSKAILPVHVKWMQLQFNGLPDESVHVTRLGRQKFGVLKFDFVIQIEMHVHYFCVCCCVPSHDQADWCLKFETFDNLIFPTLKMLPPPTFQLQTSQISIYMYIIHILYLLQYAFKIHCLKYEAGMPPTHLQY